MQLSHEGEQLWATDTLRVNTAALASILARPASIDKTPSACIAVDTLRQAMTCLLVINSPLFVR